MVSPLDVEVMIVAKRVHDDVRTRSAVVDIAHDVQGVDRQPLDKVAHGYDEVVCPLGGDDRADDHIDIGMLVGLYGRFVQQLLNDV